MGKQEDIFLESEGDAWFERNFYKIEDRKTDPVIDILRKNVSGIMGPILEFGCSNGTRLNRMYKMGLGSPVFGVDPSEIAIKNGAARYENIILRRGTAIAHPIGANAVKTLIYGFCLYVCDPEDHFEIAAQGNNVLGDQGHLVIHDFDADYPHSVPNQHVEGLMTYKMDWSRLWLNNPAYSLIEKVSFPDGTAVWLLKKDQRGAFPCLSASLDLGA